MANIINFKIFLLIYTEKNVYDKNTNLNCSFSITLVLCHSYIIIGSDIRGKFNCPISSNGLKKNKNKVSTGIFDFSRYIFKLSDTTRTIKKIYSANSNFIKCFLFLLISFSVSWKPSYKVSVVMDWQDYGRIA